MAHSKASTRRTRETCCHFTIDCCGRILVAQRVHDCLCEQSIENLHCTALYSTAKGMPQFASAPIVPTIFVHVSEKKKLGFSVQSKKLSGLKHNHCSLLGSSLVFCSFCEP